MVAAHREAWTRANGRKVPKGKCVLHHCDNPPCVNPRHLYAGTKLNNARDRVARKRSRDQRGEKHNLSILTDEQVIEMRERHAAGETSNALADVFGIDPRHVGKILRGDLWQHVAGPTRRLRTGRPRGIQPATEREIRRLVARGMKQRDLAEQFGISQAQVSRIVHR